MLRFYLFQFIMLRMLKLEIRHWRLRTEASYHTHAKNNLQQTLSWSSSVAPVVYLTWAFFGWQWQQVSQWRQAPFEFDWLNLYILQPPLRTWFQLQIFSKKSAPSKRSSPLQPICIRHLNAAPGFEAIQRTCNADHRNIGWAISFRYKSSSRFVVRLCFIL